MEAPIINYLAVFVSSIIAMAIGFVWYSSFALGKLWLQLLSKSKEDLFQEMKTRNMAGVYLAVFAGWLVCSLALAWLVGYLKVSTWDNGLVLGLWVVLGLIIPTSLQHYLFENRPLKLYVVNYGYVTVSVVVVSMLLAVWK